MKRAKITSLVTGLIGIVYFILSIVTMVQTASKLVDIATTVDPNNTAQVEEAAANMIENSGGLFGVGILNLILIVLLIVMGVLTAISMASLPKDTNGRMIGLVGGVMTAVGIVFGWIPIVNYIYIAVAAILCIVAFVMVKDRASYNGSTYR